MTEALTVDATQIFTRDTRDESVLVLDGYGLSLTVSRSHLLLSDGLGKHRRQRRLSRAQRTVRRLVILGHTGSISLEAIRWCTDTDITILHLDTDGRVLMLANTPTRTDGRLLRAQAAAPAGPVGLSIAQQLLQAKITGQAAITADFLDSTTIAQAMLDISDRLPGATTLRACRELEAQAANIYFSAWSGHARAQFSPTDTTRVPDAWQRFTVRTSPLQSGGHSPRNAADPINALLNYGYALAEAECRLAALAVRLDPALGILHTDQKGRDSFALDLLETLRPVVEQHVLQLIDGRTFRCTEFTETRDGRCRILPPLTHQLAELLLPELARAIAKPAETVAHALAHTSPGKVDLRTPLSRSNISNAQSRGQRGQNRKPAQPKSARRTCQRCGTDLYGSARKLCPTCWPVMRNSYLQQVNTTRHKKPQPEKPSIEEQSGGWTLQRYQTEILPGLAEIPLRDIEKATGLSNPTCSRVKRGMQIPNPKHWAQLAQLVGIKPTV